MNIKRNSLGTFDIIAKFKGMRKEQQFISYSLSGDSFEMIIQSDTRIGHININTGVVSLCKPISSGAYFIHLQNIVEVDKLSEQELEELNSFLAVVSKQLELVLE